MANLAKTFGERLRSLRHQRGYSQAELAERAEASQEWVRRMERGFASPSFDTLERLAAALEVPVAEFFQDAPTPPSKQVEQALADLTPDEIDWLLTGAKLLRRAKASGATD